MSLFKVCSLTLTLFTLLLNTSAKAGLTKEEMGFESSTYLQGNFILSYVTYVTNKPRDAGRFLIMRDQLKGCPEVQEIALKIFKMERDALDKEDIAKLILITDPKNKTVRDYLIDVGYTEAELNEISNLGA